MRSAREDVVVRAARMDDIDPLTFHLPPDFSPDEHRERVRDHLAGVASYLTAWRGSTPVGHVVVRWGGFTFGPLPQIFPGIPVMLKLRVWPVEIWGQGIGRTLVTAAEREAAGRGYRSIGLGVVTDNGRARRLYEHLGYVAWDGGELSERCTRLDDGQVVPYDEVFTVMTKKLYPGTEPFR